MKIEEGKVSKSNVTHFFLLCLTASMKWFWFWQLSRFFFQLHKYFTTNIKRHLHVDLLWLNDKYRHNPILRIVCWSFSSKNHPRWNSMFQVKLCDFGFSRIIGEKGFRSFLSLKIFVQYFFKSFLNIFLFQEVSGWDTRLSCTWGVEKQGI